MRTFDEIVQLVKLMQADQGPTLLQMRAVLDRYEGDWVLPVPQVPNEPTLPPLTPQLMAEAVDISNAVVYLVSDESRYVTGLELKVDGGVTIR